MNSINEIIEVKQKVEKQLFAYKGVNTVEVGYKYKNGKRTDEISIRVHVKKKLKNLSKAELIPAEIEGIKTDVIENEIVPLVLSMKLEESVSIQLDGSAYPVLKGGISMGPQRSVGGDVFVGTLGLPVKDASTGETLLLSNFHVQCIDNTWSVGDTMVQPARVDSSTGSIIGRLKRAILNSNIDGAVCSLEPGKTSLCEIVDIGNVTGTSIATLNAAVRKRGRTTNLTQGFVDSINASVSLNYGPGLGTRILYNQIGIRPNTSINPKFSDRGDSGSVVVDANNKVIGLLFAGGESGSYTFANPINHVLSDLNIQLCTNIPPKNWLKDNKDFRKEVKELRKEAIKERKEFKEFRKDTIKDFKEIRETPGDFLNNPPFGHQNLSNEADYDAMNYTQGEMEPQYHKSIIKDGKDTRDTTYPKRVKDTKDVKDSYQPKRFKDVVDNRNPKHLIKDFKERGKDFKEMYEAPGGDPRVNPPIDHFSESSNSQNEMEQYVQYLEQTIDELSAFIPQELRPDLSQGAYNNETE